MELTRVFEKEELLNMQSFYQRNDCSRRTAIELAAALLAEMNKPKVWDGAPERATDARVRWTDRNGVTGHNDMYSQLYSRIPAKSRIDEIAEEAQSSFLDGTNKPLTEVIKSAILQARKEWEDESNERTCTGRRLAEV